MLSGANPVSRRVDEERLIGLPGLEAVEHQLQDVIVVLRAEQQRRTAGLMVERPAWKNLVFTGGPGTGKSRTAAAVGRIYRELGLLSSGHTDEVSAADFVGGTRSETSALVAEPVRRASGGVLLINGAHAWYSLPDHGQQVLQRLHEKLTEYRRELLDDLAVILAGHGEALQNLLGIHPSLAARFGEVIEFPGYTPRQLAAIFSTLADEAGLSLTREAGCHAAAVLDRAADGHASCSARLAVRLLNQARAAQARRLAASPGVQHPATLSTVIEADIPDHLDCDEPPSGRDWSGQYL